ncbi:MAG: thermonuclease family protein [Actinomycetota bacterium]|nr:thermonuclease family protein [Actinomycetota bacterium]
MKTIIYYQVSYRVIDGDTIELENGDIVRYIGINTPETDEFYGDIATSKNSDLVLNKTLRLEKDVSETDKYGRLLRYVYVGDIFVNAYYNPGLDQVYYSMEPVSGK